jgi:hypothetical protein
MLVDPMEIERLPINEELALGDSHCANPDRKRVEVRQRTMRRLCGHLHLRQRASTPGESLRTGLHLCHPFTETRSCCVAQAGLDLLGSIDPPVPVRKDL